MENQQKDILIRQPGIAQINIANAISNPSTPRYYANSFAIGRSETDIFFMSISNNQVGMICNMSFQSAKKLFDLLKKNIDEIESELGEIKSMPRVINKTL